MPEAFPPVLSNQLSCDLNNFLLFAFAKPDVYEGNRTERKFLLLTNSTRVRHVVSCPVCQKHL